VSSASRSLLVLAGLLAGGCDAVFGLHPIAEPRDGGDGDAAPPVIAYLNDPLGDLDGDGDLNGVDLCPTIAGPQADGDGDGVGDACDPRTGVRDCILLFDDFRIPDSRWASASTPPWSPACAATGGLCSRADPGGVAMVSVTGTTDLISLRVGLTGIVVPTGVGGSIAVFPEMTDAGDGTGRAGVLAEDGGGTATLTLRLVDLFRGRPPAITTPATSPIPASYGPHIYETEWVSNLGGERFFATPITIAPALGMGAGPPVIYGHHVGFRTVQADIRVDYVLGYGRTCPPPP
jgi:hypothetical protein